MPDYVFVENCGDIHVITVTPVRTAEEVAASLQASSGCPATVVDLAYVQNWVFLACQGGASRPAVIDIVWDDYDDLQAHQALQQSCTTGTAAQVRSGRTGEERQQDAEAALAILEGLGMTKDQAIAICSIECLP